VSPRTLSILTMNARLSHHLFQFRNRHSSLEDVIEMVTGSSDGKGEKDNFPYWSAARTNA
jgi:hypothetical protein